MNWQLKSIAFLIQFLFLFVSGDESSHKVCYKVSALISEPWR